MIKKYFALSLIAASVAVAGCSDDDDDEEVIVDPGTDPVVVVPDAATPGVGGSVYDTIFLSTEHTSLLAAIDAAGLADTLDDESKDYTVFAPDDAAFAALTAAPTGDALVRTLQYHVVEGTYLSTDLTELVAVSTADATLPTLTPDVTSLTFTNSDQGQGLAVDGVAIIGADLVPDVAEGETTTGVVHSIGAVLTAPDAPEEPVVVDPGTGEPGTVGPVATALAAANTAFSDAFIAAYSSIEKLDKAPADEVDPWTVFAPTNAAAGDTEIVIGNYIITGTKYTAQDLIDAGTINNFNGTALTFGGTAEALTVNGFDAVLVGDGTAASATYSIEGVL